MEFLASQLDYSSLVHEWIESQEDEFLGREPVETNSSQSDDEWGNDLEDPTDVSDIEVDWDCQIEDTPVAGKWNDQKYNNATCSVLNDSSHIEANNEALYYDSSHTEGNIDTVYYDSDFVHLYEHAQDNQDVLLHEEAQQDTQDVLLYEETAQDQQDILLYEEVVQSEEVEEAIVQDQLIYEVEQNYQDVLLCEESEQNHQDILLYEEVVQNEDILLQEEIVQDHQVVLHDQFVPDHPFQLNQIDGDNFNAADQDADQDADPHDDEPVSEDSGCLDNEESEHGYDDCWHGWVHRDDGSDADSGIHQMHKNGSTG